MHLQDQGYFVLQVIGNVKQVLPNSMVVEAQQKKLKIHRKNKNYMTGFD